MLYQNFLTRLVIFLPCLGNNITRGGNKITRRGNKCAIDIQVLIGMKIYFLGMKKTFFGHDFHTFVGHINLPHNLKSLSPLNLKTS